MFTSIAVIVFIMWFVYFDCGLSYDVQCMFRTRTESYNENYFLYYINNQEAVMVNQRLGS